MQKSSSNIEKTRVSSGSSIDSIATQEVVKQQKNLQNIMNFKESDIFFKVTKPKKYKKKLSKNKESDPSDNESIDNLLIDDFSFKSLKTLTQNFELTYKKIQHMSELKEKPLSDLSKEEIQYIIRKARQNFTRNYGGQIDCNGNKFCQRLALKRIKPNYFEDPEYEYQNKRQKSMSTVEEIQIQSPNPLQNLALTLIQQFENQDVVMKNKIIDQISLLLEQDKQIYFQAIQNSASQLIDMHLDLFQERKYFKLQQIFDKVSPMAVILANLQITSKLPNLPEEGNTLIQTLLPYLSKCPNFSFINLDCLSIVKRIIQTLVLYYQDTKQVLNEGFSKFALQFGPSLIQPLINSNEEIQVLSKTFSYNGFSIEESKIISKYPPKFLWEELIMFLKELNSNNRIQYIQIFSKLIILQNPAPFISQLMDQFARRNVFITCLSECQDIPFTIEQLIQILDEIKRMSTENIIEILSKDPKFWQRNINQKLDFAIESSQMLNDQQIHKFINEKNVEFNVQNIINVETITEFSKIMEKNCKFYQHNKYQCAIVSLILSNDSQYKIVEMPTGSGKTWVQALISQYYISKGMKVAIIEPNENLKLQTQELLADLSYDLKILSIQEFYDFPPSDQVVIVNEYDTIVENYPFKAVNDAITGLWQFLNRQVLFFTATTNTIIERIIKNIFQKFLVLKFKNEYELIKNISAISQGIIKPCSNLSEVLKMLAQDIIQNYNETPIIIFCQPMNQQIIKNILIENNIKLFKEGCNQEILREIRTWKQGILILNPDDGIGINCKFSKNSLVLITNEMQSESQYLQTQGRRTRARGLCNSIYYPITSQESQQILRNMKSQHYTKIQELERVIKVIWCKRTLKDLSDQIEFAQDNGETIKSMKDLETIIGRPKYLKIIKGIQF